MAHIYDRGGNIWDSETGYLLHAGHTPMAPPHMPISGPVVTYPPTPAAYEDVSRIDAIRELRRLVSESTISEPVGHKDGTYNLAEHGLAYMDIPRVHLNISAAKAMLGNLERNGFKLVRVIK